MAKNAVVLLHRGDPRNADELEPFLRALYSDPGSTSLPFGAAVQNVLGGWIARMDVKTLGARLAAVGGRVDFMDKLETTAAELEKLFNGPAQGTAGADFVVRVAFSCKSGGFTELQAKLKSEGVTRVVGVSLYSHKASRRGGAVVQAFLRAFDDSSGMTVSVIERLASEPGYLTLLKEQLKTGSSAIGSELVKDAAVICAAPGIEKADFDTGDEYRPQVEQTAAALVAGSDLKVKVAWLGDKMPGPALGAVMAALAAEGCKALLLVPLGTTVDELVVLHALDVEAKALAEKLGLRRLDRAGSLSTEPGFVPLLHQAVNDHLTRISALGLR